MGIAITLSILRRECDAMALIHEMLCLTDRGLPIIEEVSGKYMAHIAGELGKFF